MGHLRKVLESTVYDLLGGKYRDKVRSYTYLFNLETGNLLEATADWAKNPGKLAEIAAERVEEGFTCVKVDPLHQAMPGQLPCRGKSWMPKSTICKPWASK